MDVGRKVWSGAKDMGYVQWHQKSTHCLEAIQEMVLIFHAQEETEILPEVPSLPLSWGSICIELWLMSPGRIID